MVLGLHLLSLAPGYVARSPPSPPWDSFTSGSLFLFHDPGIVSGYRHPGQIVRDSSLKLALGLRYQLQNALHVLVEDRISRHDRHRDLQRIDRNSRKGWNLQFR